MTLEQLEANQRDIITVLQFAIADRTPADQVVYAMQRSLAQMPQPPAIDKMKLLAEQERIEKNKGPRSVRVTPGPREIPDGEQRAEFLERMKQPINMPAKVVA